MTLPSFRTPSLKSSIAALALLAAAGFARTAAAQIGTGTGGSIGTTTTTFSPDDFLIVIQDPKGSALLDFDLQRFFNIANCNCNTPVFPFFTFSQSGLAKRTALPEGTIQFLVGYQCDQLNFATQCVKIGPDLPLSTFAASGGVTLTSSAQALSTYFGQPVVSTSIEQDGGIVTTTTTPTMPGGNICASNIAFTQNLFALITFAGSQNAFDVDVTAQISIDLNPPPAPANLVAEPGNEALIASWTGIDTVGTPDFLGYQLLCDRGGSLQVFKTGTFSPQFHTCPGMLATTPTDQNINALDENFTCSGLLTADTTSDRIKILQNGVTYGVAVVAIDQHYNASPPMVVYGVPIKTLSFYDVYRNGDSQVDPGQASGGFCAVRAGPIRMSGWATLASLGGLAVGVVLVGLRRRRRRRP